MQAKLKEAEDMVEELNAKLKAVQREKAQLEARLAEFTHTLAQRDELIAQLRSGNQVNLKRIPHTVLSPRCVVSNCSKPVNIIAFCLYVV